jgi:hypothetical protein
MLKLSAICEDRAAEGTERERRPSALSVTYKVTPGCLVTRDNSRPRPRSLREAGRHQSASYADGRVEELGWRRIEPPFMRPSCQHDGFRSLIKFCQPKSQSWSMVAHFA